MAWNDLEEWAGSRIVSRGKNYQGQGRVRDLAVTEDHDLIAWVDGTERYATKVVLEDDGLPAAICTCPYEWDCKHAVAVVIEYLKRIEDNRPVPKISPNVYCTGTTSFQRNDTGGTALTTMPSPRPFKSMPRIEQ